LRADGIGRVVSLNPQPQSDDQTNNADQFLHKFLSGLNVLATGKRRVRCPGAMKF